MHRRICSFADILYKRKQRNEDMRRILFAIMCLMTAISMKAVRAFPFPVDVIQPDGTTLTIIQHGDEDFHYLTTFDGVLLVEKDGSYYVASVDLLGNLSPTAQLAHNAPLRTDAERRLAE